MLAGRVIAQGNIVSTGFKCRANKLWLVPIVLVLLNSFMTAGLAQQTGVTATSIRLGAIMDLEGDSRGLGLNMKAGLEAAFAGQQINGRSIELLAENDFYNPETTVRVAGEMIQRGVFAMIGNVGTPTAQAVLPILADNKIPAIGFFTGAGLLRPGVGDIVNYRASYTQETAAVIALALVAGIAPEQICAYVQNDAYGMAGVAGIKIALSGRSDSTAIIAALDKVLALEGANARRDNLGPVGIYERNTLRARSGYESLKNWEAITGIPCRLVVTVGTYIPVANFASYVRYKGDNWIISAVSFTGADNLQQELNNSGVRDGIIMTQVVPPLDTSSGIVAQARALLGEQLNYVSLEGFIVGRMFLKIMEFVPEPITRQSFINAMRGHGFDLDGLLLDFSDDNQASDLVISTLLRNGQFTVIERSALQQELQR